MDATRKAALVLLKHVATLTRHRQQTTLRHSRGGFLLAAGQFEEESKPVLELGGTPGFYLFKCVLHEICTPDSLDLLLVVAVGSCLCRAMCHESLHLVKVFWGHVLERIQVECP